MIHKASEHRNLPAKHFLIGPNATRRDQAFCDCRIQARSALYCRAPGIVAPSRNLELVLVLALGRFPSNIGSQG